MTNSKNSVQIQCNNSPAFSIDEEFFANLQTLFSASEHDVLVEPLEFGPLMQPWNNVTIMPSKLCWMLFELMAVLLDENSNDVIDQKICLHLNKRGADQIQIDRFLKVFEPYRRDFRLHGIKGVRS